MKQSLVLFFILLGIVSNTIQANSIISNDGNSVEIKEDIKLYEKPSINSNVLTIIKAGSIITIVSTEKEFSKVKYLKLTGYIITSKLKTYNITSTNSYSTKSTTGTSKTKTTKSKPGSTNYNKSTNYSSTCGATTKKGGSCQRRVSGGGYCWQHR